MHFFRKDKDVRKGNTDEVHQHPVPVKYRPTAPRCLCASQQLYKPAMQKAAKQFCHRKKGMLNGLRPIPKPDHMGECLFHSNPLTVRLLWCFGLGTRIIWSFLVIFWNCNFLWPNLIVWQSIKRSPRHSHQASGSLRSTLEDCMFLYCKVMLVCRKKQAIQVQLWENLDLLLSMALKKLWNLLYVDLTFISPNTLVIRFHYTKTV